LSDQLFFAVSAAVTLGGAIWLCLPIREPKAILTADQFGIRVALAFPVKKDTAFEMFPWAAIQEVTIFNSGEGFYIQIALSSGRTHRVPIIGYRKAADRALAGIISVHRGQPVDSDVMSNHRVQPTPVSGRG